MSRTKHSDNDGRGEYTNKRLDRYLPVGRWSKQTTHRNERRNARQNIRQLLDQIEEDREQDFLDFIIDDEWEDSLFAGSWNGDIPEYDIPDDYEDLYEAIDDDYRRYDDDDLWYDDVLDLNGFEQFHSEYLSQELTKAQLKIKELERQLQNHGIQPR